MSEYWRICAEEALDEVGIGATEEQTNQLAEFMEGAHEAHDLHTGVEVANANWRSCKDRGIQQAAQKSVFEFVRGLTSTIDYGPDFFDHMSHDQRIAMHKLFELPKFYQAERP